MKKYLKFVTLILFLSILFYACSSSTTEEKNNSKISFSAYKLAKENSKAYVVKNNTSRRIQYNVDGFVTEISENREIYNVMYNLDNRLMQTKFDDGNVKATYTLNERNLIEPKLCAVPPQEVWY